jgi:malonate-semialdehyde dehydrogenase (acetylating)/methylmalonate-semialdehyde dehydrogenase
MKRYFSVLDKGIDPHGQKELRKLALHIDGEWRESTSSSYRECFNPSTGAVIAKLAQCTIAEMDEAVAAAKAAFPEWAATPVGNRTQVLFRM